MFNAKNNPFQRILSLLLSGYLAFLTVNTNPQQNVSNDHSSCYQSSYSFLENSILSTQELQIRSNYRIIDSFSKFSQFYQFACESFSEKYVGLSYLFKGTYYFSYSKSIFLSLASTSIIFPFHYFW